jgi:hypothetical protein
MERANERVAENVFDAVMAALADEGISDNNRSRAAVAARNAAMASLDDVKPLGPQMVAVKGCQECRAVTFGPAGQRMECWLPRGDWFLDATCYIRESRETGTLAPAVRIRRSYKGCPETWHIGVDAAHKLGFRFSFAGD